MTPPSPLQSSCTRSCLAVGGGIVRQGLAAVAGQEAPAQVGTVAETLALDVPRLHRAQNDFQRLVVLAACLLLTAQARSDAAAQVNVFSAILSVQAICIVPIAAWPSAGA